MENEKILEEILGRLRYRLSKITQFMLMSKNGEQQAFYDGKSTGLIEAIEVVSKVLAMEKEIAAEEEGEELEAFPPKIWR